MISYVEESPPRCSSFIYAPFTPIRQTIRRPLQSSVVRFSQNRSDRKYERPFTPSPSSVIHRQSRSVRERF